MKIFKFLLLATLAVMTVAATWLTIVTNGWNIEKQNIDTLSSLLRPAYEVYRPEGSGPFPTIIGAHGCSGVLQGIRDWAEQLKQAGYATVLVDSMSPRALEWQPVCSGRALWGNERAGDIVTALKDVRAMPFVDQRHLILMGWSHGGWAMLDLLSYASFGKSPPNLQELPYQPLDGVSAVIAIYPFCDFPAQLRKGWRTEIPVHFVFAEHDSIVDNNACRKVIDKQISNGQLVTEKTYLGVNHAFDMKPQDFFEEDVYSNTAMTNMVHADLIAFLKKIKP